MAPAKAASPSTWMPGIRVDSKVSGWTRHQPVASATLAATAIEPAICGGITLATAALIVSKSVLTVIAPESTLITRPPIDIGTHSIMPG